MTSPAALPADWMPKASMDRIIVHWTAGTGEASSLDRRHYHVLIEADGNLIRGDLPISANARPIRGAYAAHVLNSNTGSIGVALCGMHGATEAPFSAGEHALTEVQWDALLDVCATLSIAYHIPPLADRILSHAEVQGTLGITQRGKWDIARLPWAQDADAHRIGDRLRREIAEALDGRRSIASARAIREPAGVDRVAADQHELEMTGVVTASTLNVRAAPNGRIIGSLPRGTRISILDHDDGWSLVRSPAGYEGHVASRYIALSAPERGPVIPPEPAERPDAPRAPAPTSPPEITMTEQKSWARSKGVLGAAGAMLIPMIGELVGLSIDDGTAQAPVEQITVLAAAASAGIALIGRITASSRIR